MITNLIESLEAQYKRAGFNADNIKDREKDLENYNYWRGYEQATGEAIRKARQA